MGERELRERNHITGIHEDEKGEGQGAGHELLLEHSVMGK